VRRGEGRREEKRGEKRLRVYAYAEICEAQVIHTYAYIHTYIHTYKHTNMHTNIHYIHAYITYITYTSYTHPSIHTYIHTSIHTYMHPHIHTDRHILHTHLLHFMIRYFFMRKPCFVSFGLCMYACTHVFTYV